jgi:hypothetical protein
MVFLPAIAKFAKKQPRNWASLVRRIVAVARLTLVVLGSFGFAKTTNRPRIGRFTESWTCLCPYSTKFDALGTGDWQASPIFEIMTASTNP